MNVVDVSVELLHTSTVVIASSVRRDAYIAYRSSIMIIIALRLRRIETSVSDTCIVQLCGSCARSCTCATYNNVKLVHFMLFLRARFLCTCAKPAFPRLLGMQPEKRLYTLFIYLIFMGVRGVLRLWSCQHTHYNLACIGSSFLRAIQRRYSYLSHNFVFHAANLQLEQAIHAKPFT